MKKKGFTLMELLAVIVILAVLALLVIPIIGNLIKTSKKEAFRISVGQVNDNVLFHYANEWILEGMSEDKVINFNTSENVNLLNLAGKLPSGGTVTINPQGKTIINVNDGVFCAIKEINDSKILVGELEDGVCTLTGESISTCPYRVGYSWNFEYVDTGDDRSQDFQIPCDGKYRLEVWGASGGKHNTVDKGGYGGYSTGEIELEFNNHLFINIGGEGESSTSTSGASGGYNGGGNGGSGSSFNGINYTGGGGGGGATHIALETGLLTSFESKQDQLLIVAGGGGGSSAYPDDTVGGSGGGATGGSSSTNACRSANSYLSVDGGSLNNGFFGQGQNASNRSYGKGCGAEGKGGGGGGFYGGRAYQYDGDGSSLHGGGGSGYLSSTLANKAMYCYACNYSDEEASYTLSGHEVSDLAKSYKTKKGNGYARITYLGEETTTILDSCIVGEGYTWEFDYKEINNEGVEQTFKVPCSGYYKLEVWGAQGGTGVYTAGGYGAYSRGKILLGKNNNLYINVGGTTSTNVGGYNGGGTASYSLNNGNYRFLGGGGATHIGLDSGLLTTYENKVEQLLLVAGGGSGAYNFDSSYYIVGTHAGGYLGNDGNTYKSSCHSGNVETVAAGGSQSSGGIGYNGSTSIQGSFGQGGNGPSSGGGGGYYGGGGTYNPGCSAETGGGGSSYTSPVLLEKVMYCYDCRSTTTSNQATVTNLNSSKVAKSYYSKQGNGYAKITYLGSTPKSNECDIEENYVWAFNYNGQVQSFISPCHGTYKLETWGAQGGNSGSGTKGGYGSYSTGTLALSYGNPLYVVVGGAGSGNGSHIARTGGYNGGGDATSNTDDHTRQGSGGGATHIAVSNYGELKYYENHKDDIVIVSGGGGGAAGNSVIMYVSGGQAGGYIGNDGGTYSESNWSCTGSGASSNNGALFGIGGSTYASGGGGGYYGGLAVGYSAGGGTGYIGYTRLYDKYMYCYNCTTSPASNVNTYTKSDGTNSCHNSTAQEDCAKDGNGYARIKFISETEDIGDSPTPTPTCENEPCILLDIISTSTGTCTGEGADVTAPTCTFYYFAPLTNGIRVSFSCTDETSVPTVASMYNSTTKQAYTFAQITDPSRGGTVKTGSVSGNTRTITSSWTTNYNGPKPSPGLCYYYQFAAKDACGNERDYVTTNCSYGFRN